MRVIQRTGSIGAGAVNDNIFSGSAFEFLPSNAVVSMGINTGSGMLGTITIGSTAIMEESVMPIGTDFPIIPDRIYYTFAGAQGDRLVARLRNPTAGALSYWAFVQINEM